MICFANDIERAVRVVEAYRPALRAQLLRRTGCCATADDLMQELALRLARAPGFAFTDRPGAYAQAAAANVARDWFRKTMRRRAHEHAAGTLRGTVMMDELERRETWGAVCAALGELPAAQRRAVEGRELEGLGCDELAAELGVTVRDVSQLRVRGLRRLRRRLCEGA